MQISQSLEPNLLHLRLSEWHIARWTFPLSCLDTLIHTILTERWKISWVMARKLYVYTERTVHALCDNRRAKVYPTCRAFQDWLACPLSITITCRRWMTHTLRFSASELSAVVPVSFNLVVCLSKSRLDRISSSSNCRSSALFPSCSCWESLYAFFNCNQINETEHG